ncbi:MAG: cation:proton antiporter [Pseudomonadota bacterium]|nr:cation:proton antiporter [Pseudomonadota bacterium]
MHDSGIIFSIFLIFTGAAVLATVALYARQAMLVAYLALGAILGPWGLGLVTDPELLQEIAHIGIIFLLFLLGLNLYPQKLLQLLGETMLVTLVSSLVFALVAAGLAWLFGLRGADLVLVGVAAMFSSTIVGLKLLPTTVLHHRHTGEVIISVLLLQDMIAILVLLVLQGMAHRGEVPLLEIGQVLLAMPLLWLVAWVGQRYVLMKLLLKYDRIQEYVFLLAIGWCLGIAQLAHTLGLSYEVGAFTAGVALAASPIAVHIAERLKPLRDFFLVMFFFGIGAGFDPSAARNMLLPALLLAVAMLVMKPVVFRLLLVKAAENKRLAWETGVRLGQMSEFSLLIVFVAREAAVLSTDAANLIQLATLLTFVASSYLIVLRYPTPIALSDKLRRD